MIDNIRIQYPNNKYKKCIENIYKICVKNKLSLIVKGSLAKGKCTSFSDIDLLIIGEIDNLKIDEIIEAYGIPIMINITESPKGIYILLYEDGISIDLDVRNKILKEELKNSLILLDYNLENYIRGRKVIRIEIESKYIINRPKWYKVLRLIHRAFIKYLSYKMEEGYELLKEIKQEIRTMHVDNLRFNGDFK